MLKRSDHKKQSKSQLKKNSTVQAKKNASISFELEDNRSAAKQQEDIQELADNSDNVQRMQSIQQAADEFTAKQEPHVQRKENKTGLPDQLKTGIENLSGFSMDDVKVHYNSDKPSQLQAHAYAQGTDIHLASGQEKHLPHEAWHVVQQKQGRVKPTKQLKSKVNINDDSTLEKEADEMGAKAAQLKQESKGRKAVQQLVNSSDKPIQRMLIEGEEGIADQIKIIVDDEIRVVYLSRAWSESDKYVYYSEEKFKKPKGKRKLRIDSEERISADKAFSVYMGNDEIRAEIGHAEAADEFGYSEEFIAFFRALLAEYDTDNQYERATNAHIAHMMNSIISIYLKYLEGDESAIMEAIEDSRDYYGPEAVNDMERTEARTARDEEAISAAAGGGGGGSEEWKTKKTEKLKGELKGRMTGDSALETELRESVSTLHHKMAKSRLKRMLELLAGASESEGKTAMLAFIARIKGLTGSSKDDVALSNWTANIELGPLVDHRAPGDDPGSEFDGSFPGGAATPRTSFLDEVNAIISSAESPDEVPWGDIADKLNQVQDQHAAMITSESEDIGEDAFTLPKLEQWTHTGAGYARDKKAVSSTTSTESPEAAAAGGVTIIAGGEEETKED